jgi:hypothetical protein
MPQCENHTWPATWEVTMTNVVGTVTRMYYCDECACGLGDWVFPNNDGSFSGPADVVETLSYRLLNPQPFRRLAAERN